MSDELRTWLAQEIDRRGWSHRMLARQISLSHSLVSKALSGKMRASADFCIRVAQALDEPPEKVLRLAGILPMSPANEHEQALKEILDIAKNMTPENRQDLLNYARYRYQQQGGKKK